MNGNAEQEKSLLVHSVFVLVVVTTAMHLHAVLSGIEYATKGGGGVRGLTRNQNERNSRSCEKRRKIYSEWVNE